MIRVTISIYRLLAVGPNKLLLAASIGDTQLIRQLISEEGVSPSHVFPHGVTALHEACESGQLEAVRIFIDSGADVNKQVAMCMYRECRALMIKTNRVSY